MALGLRHELPLSNGGSLSTSVDYTHTDDMRSNVTVLDFVNLPSNHSLSARIQYSAPNDRWDVAVFATNLTDDILDRGIRLSHYHGRERRARPGPTARSGRKFPRRLLGGLRVKRSGAPGLFMAHEARSDSGFPRDAGGAGDRAADSLRRGGVHGSWREPGRHGVVRPPEEEVGMKRFRLAIAAFGCLGACAGALAHHSIAMFDNENSAVLTGTVQAFHWQNPHCLLGAGRRHRDEHNGASGARQGRSLVRGAA